MTGGNGFVGSATVLRLEAAGHTALVVDRSSGHDILTEPLPPGDAVIHLAGVLGTAELFAQPMHAVDANVKGTIRVLQQCESFDMRYVGITMPSVWANVYQATKHCAREMASAWHRHFGVPVSHVRAFNAYGPGQPHGPAHPQKIIPTFSYHAWRNQPIPVWGDGTQTVDLVHVDDIARMLVDALEFGDDDVFDAGTGVACDVLEVARIVTNTTGSTAGVEHRPMRKGEDPGTNIVATGEGWDKLGWSPVVSINRLMSTISGYQHARSEVPA